MRYAIKNGVKDMIKKIEGKQGNGYKAFAVALESAIILSERYAELAEEKAACAASPEKKAQFELMSATLRKVPENGAKNLYEAILDVRFDHRDFYDKMNKLGILEQINETVHPTQKNEAKLFRFNKAKYEELKNEGFKLII